MHEGIDQFSLTWTIQQVSHILFMKNGMEPFFEYLVKNKGQVLVLTHHEIRNHHPSFFKQMESFKNVDFLLLKSGEQTKSWEQAGHILEYCARTGLRRNGLLIAVGGGVLGDLTGFVASIYMRGIRWWNIPTTLLALIDSSIGGKTGIDLKKGKNLIGTFYLPEYVFASPHWLRTLPEIEWYNGFGELIKYGILMGGSIWDTISHISSLHEVKERQVVHALISDCIQYKSNIVSQDPYDSGIRQLLNLGHTVGHAIESWSQYALPHGYAVLLGLVVEAEIARGRSAHNDQLIERLLSFVYEYPEQTPHLPSFEDIKLHLAVDKKQITGPEQEWRFALPYGPGDVRIEDDIKTDEIREALNRCRNLFKHDSR